MYYLCGHYVFHSSSTLVCFYKTSLHFHLSNFTSLHLNLTKIFSANFFLSYVHLSNFTSLHFHSSKLEPMTHFQTLLTPGAGFSIYIFFQTFVSISTIYLYDADLSVGLYDRAFDVFYQNQNDDVFWQKG